MGSVKDLLVYKKATESELGVGEFVFSDSKMDDWGEMPDHIPYKGEALCLMTAWNFEKLREQGYHSHYQGVQNTPGEPATINQIVIPPKKIMVSLSRVVKPEFNDGIFDYSYFVNGRGTINNFVVPLEVIYRNGAPNGSSLFRTLDNLEKLGRISDMNRLLSHYGLRTKPNPGDLFPKTGFDFTTKFEPTDIKISDEEAYRISGLTREQFSQLESLRQAAVALVSERAREVGFVDYDGKHEYRLFNGRVEMADVFGTL